MIGIFGGTFDPVHYGHIKPALSVMQALALSELRFIPNNIPPHRDSPWLPVKKRLQLLQCVVDDYPEIILDQRELNRDGVSYMVDTLKSLKQEFVDETLCLIIGMDAFIGISQWHEWRSIFNYCHLVVTTRPGYQQESISAQMEINDYHFLKNRMITDVSMLAAQENGKILLQSVPQLDISSTRIRQMLASKIDISQWVPDAVGQQLMRKTINDN